MKTKITVISFDNWNYDNHIVSALNRINCEANHINFGKYKYTSLYKRVYNLLSKIFLSKNLKIKYRQEFIIEMLKKLGPQDQILVLNPDLIETECHQEIKKYTKRYIAYLYDSIARSEFPIEHLLKDVFDKIYSFDIEDCKKYGFIKTCNYIYLPENILVTNSEKKYNVINISSFDKRFESINEIANQLKNYKIKFNFLIVGKNIDYKVLKFRVIYWLKHKKSINIDRDIKFKSKKIGLDELISQYNNGNIILDLVQGKQTGLSFRVFEAMALKKKLITDNKAIKEYSFFNPANIMVIEKNKIKLDTNFFNSPYQEIDNNIYEEYIIDSWVKKVFGLKN
jgi:hypothetical protein